MADELKIEALVDALDAARYQYENGESDDFGRITKAKAAIIAAWNRRATPEPGEAWQPIETAPKDGAWVLAARGVIPYVTAWDDGEEIWFTFNRGYESVREKHEGLKGVVWEPTHWMPLPQPPALAALRAKGGNNG